MAYIIGISGGSGSGKTTFINALRAQFTEQELCIISQDNYYLPIEKQEMDLEGFHNFDLPKSFDHQAFIDDIQKLVSGKTITIPEYIFNDESITPGLITYRPAPIIIAEGIFLFYEEMIRNLTNLKIFIDAKDDLKLIRRIRRDQNERNQTVEQVLYRYEKTCISLI